MILVTGGAGYIGTHTCVELLNAGHEVAVCDNFSNSHVEALQRVQRITGKTLSVFRADVRDRAAMVDTLRATGAVAVVHFAGLKAVGVSMRQPLSYYDNNVAGTLSLLQAMDECGVRTLVFSSTASVYGDPAFLPYTEAHPLAPCNVYGRTKLVTEQMLRDLHTSDPRWGIAVLRYFNPIGAHASGLIGEDPRGTPDNLLPLVAQVAVGQRQALAVLGNDYPTPDGTGVRDYVHVVDLAIGHLKALECVRREPRCVAINLGTGQGVSVMELLRAFEQASGRTIAHHFAPRRPGDIAAYYSDPALAHQLLGWRAERDLDAMCRDAWRWQQNNPTGYAEAAEETEEPTS